MRYTVFCQFCVLNIFHFPANLRHTRPVTRGAQGGQAPKKMYWTSIKIIGHTSKILGPSQKTLRPSWWPKLVHQDDWKYWYTKGPEAHQDDWKYWCVKKRQQPELELEPRYETRELRNRNYAHESKEFRSWSRRHVHEKEKLRSLSSFIFMTAPEPWYIPTLEYEWEKRFCVESFARIEKRDQNYKEKLLPSLRISFCVKRLLAWRFVVTTWVKITVNMFKRL